MSLTPPPPPPPPHKSSSTGSHSTCQSLSNSNPTKHQSRSFTSTSTPPLSTISHSSSSSSSSSSTNTVNTTNTNPTVRSDDDDPLPSDLPDPGRLREILVDITEETNNQSIQLRRNSSLRTTPTPTRTPNLMMNPNPNPLALPNRSGSHTGPITRSRSMIIIPTIPLRRSRSQTPIINSRRSSQIIEEVNENERDSPTTNSSRSVSNQLTLTPSHSLPTFHHHLIYTPSPLGDRTFELHQGERQEEAQSGSQHTLRLRNDSSLVDHEPILTRRRRRRSEDEISQPIQEEVRITTRVEHPIRSTRFLRRFRENHQSDHIRNDSNLSITNTNTNMNMNRQEEEEEVLSGTLIGNPRDEKRRKRNSTNSHRSSRFSGLGRL